MTRAVIYARYSSDNQREASIEDQIRLCRERAEKEGWTVVKTYTDHAISGASLLLRPGVQQLIAGAGAFGFDVILSESLDRLSRDQEDIAGIYKRMAFAGVRIVTLSEGDVSELHIGLKGTMGALYLKDLADKTRRGLRGRVEAGRSGGGNAYGYDVVRRMGKAGAVERGERTINELQAKIVRRIFQEYADGKAPQAIAIQLNKDGIAGPAGKAWGPSTIYGSAKRGNGILNNEMYIGRIVWNRQRFIKDPDTGKRVSRLNPESEWIVRDVPELRIVAQELWDCVKARQKAVKTKRGTNTENGFWDRRRPRHLFSGLTKCGVCGGGYTTLYRNRLGCSAARVKGTCDNHLKIDRQRCEGIVLDGLRTHLMQHESFAVFCEEYTRELNRRRMEMSAALSAQTAELERVERDLAKLIQALKDGVPALAVRDEMIVLENRKAELTMRLAEGETLPPLVHPSMARLYEAKVEALYETLDREQDRTEAVEIIQSLVESITITPKDDGLEIHLIGDLAGILRLASEDRQTKKPPFGGGFEDMQLKLVAGVGFEPTTFRL